MSSIVAEGEAILRSEAQRQAMIEAQARAEAEFDNLPEAIIALLNMLMRRVDALEGMVMACHEDVRATRIRRAVRNAAGEIDYVIDELVSPRTPPSTI